MCEKRARDRREKVLQKEISHLLSDDGKGAKADDLAAFQSKQTMFFLDLLITQARKKKKQQ